MNALTTRPPFQPHWPFPEKQISSIQQKPWFQPPVPYTDAFGLHHPILLKRLSTFCERWRSPYGRSELRLSIRNN